MHWVANKDRLLSCHRSPSESSLQAKQQNACSGQPLQIINQKRHQYTLLQRVAITLYYETIVRQYEVL